ncbi:hypothetical protein [Nocardiopsis sp. HUAS JQ3]|nr:hypothetical protein [Nocardiopsis sp. HUAS JQ3]WDZ91416.1 hypothetical protein PV789_02250 [Nocardiopsis sp. HUAS JQ3]
MKAERIHLRVDDQQKALLEAASSASGDTVWPGSSRARAIRRTSCC